MDEILNNKVVCCFCGQSLLLGDAAVLEVRPNFGSKESQQLFCHKEHLIEQLHNSIILHPDFFQEE